MKPRNFPGRKEARRTLALLRARENVDRELRYVRDLDKRSLLTDELARIDTELAVFGAKDPT